MKRWQFLLIGFAAALPATVFIGFQNGLLPDAVYLPEETPVFISIAAVYLAPFGLLASTGPRSKRAACVLALATVAACILIYNAFSQPVIGANIGGGILVFFAPLLITAVAYTVEGVFPKRA